MYPVRYVKQLFFNQRYIHVYNGRDYDQWSITKYLWHNKPTIGMVIHNVRSIWTNSAISCKTHANNHDNSILRIFLLSQRLPHNYIQRGRIRYTSYALKELGILGSICNSRNITINTWKIGERDWRSVQITTCLKLWNVLPKTHWNISSHLSFQLTKYQMPPHRPSWWKHTNVINRVWSSVHSRSESRPTFISIFTYYIYMM